MPPLDPIDVILKNEGGSIRTNDPLDPGGRTQYGISERANPGAWADGKVTEAEARAIYQKKYVIAPGFDKIKDKQLQTQLIDYGVNSGPMVAIMKLQAILQVNVDGIIGPATLAALDTIHPEDVNNLLVAARVKMIGHIVVNRPSQLRFLNGWLDRALQFLM